MTIDVAAVRADTPGCANVAHLYNCGAGLMPRQVLDSLTGHLTLEAEIGGYEAANRCEAAVAHSYDAIAKLLNCDADEIAMVENATVGWDMAFYGMSFQPGDRILTAVSEYASNYIAFLQVAQRTGAEIVVVPNDAAGQLDVAALENLIDARARLIAVTHVPTNGGLVNPAAEIGRVARAAGVPFLLDACQAAGHIALDVQAIGCDMLSATGRKYLRGPRGTGFLYVARHMLDKLEPPFLDLHAASWVAPDRYKLRPDAKRFENWESYIAGKIGLGVAVDYALALGMDAIEERIDTLATNLRQRLGSIPGVTVQDLGARKCGIISFSIDGVDPNDVVNEMTDRNINIGTSSVFSTRIDMGGRDIALMNRMGLHYYNSEDELDRFAGLVEELSQR